MPSRTQVPARLAGDPSLSAKASSPSSETPNSRTNGHHHIALTNSPPSTAASHKEASSPSPAASVSVNAPRVPSQIVDLPQRPSSAVNGPSPHQPSTTVTSLQVSSSTDITRSSSATPSRSDRGQRPTPAPNLSATTPNSLSAAIHVASVEAKSSSSARSTPRSSTRSTLRGGDSLPDTLQGSSGNSARKKDHTSRGVFRVSTAPPMQQEKRKMRKDQPVDIAGAAPPVKGEGPTTTTSSSSGQRSQLTRPDGEDVAHGNSHPSLSVSSPLLSTEPSYRGAAAAGSFLERQKKGLSSTYTPAMNSAGAADGKKSPDVSLCHFPFRSTSQDGEEEEERQSHYIRKPSVPVSVDKPWLSKPEGSGILKTRNAGRPRPGTILIASTPTTKKMSFSAMAPSLSSASSTNVQTLRSSRHVHFDEANIQYLDASASHIIYDDSQIGVQLSNEEWGEVMLSSSRAPGYGEVRRADTGMAVSMGKAKSSAWGADSEWFNVEFGAQLEPHADHSDLSSPALSASWPRHMSTPLHRSAALPASRDHTPLTPTMAHASNGEFESAGAAKAKQWKPHSQTNSASKRLNHKKNKQLKQRQQQQKLCTRRSPVHPHNDDTEKSAIEVLCEESDDEVRESSPVLAYDRDTFNTTVTPHAKRSLHSLRSISPPMAASASSVHSANDVVVPALLLSACGLRRRSSSAQTSPSTSPLLQRTQKGSGSRSRFSSPGVSSNVDRVGRNMDDADEEDNFKTLSGMGRRDVLNATVRPPSPPQPPKLQAAVLHAEQPAEESGDSADLSETSSTTALELSDAEQRLLWAVMHMSQKRYAGHWQSNMKGGGNLLDTTMATRTSMTSTKGKVNGARALSMSTRAFGDLGSALLSSSSLQSLAEDGAGDRTENKQKGGDSNNVTIWNENRENRRASSPSPADPSPSLGGDVWWSRSRVDGTRHPGGPHAAQRLVYRQK